MINSLPAVLSVTSFLQVEVSFNGVGKNEQDDYLGILGNIISSIMFLVKLVIILYALVV